MSTVYFHALSVIRAKNIWFESITCLYSNPFTYRKRSASCLGAFPFESHLEMPLQKGSVLCTSSSTCNLSSVSSFGVASGVSVILMISSVVVSVLECRVRFSIMLLCAVLLLVWNAGPSWLVADSI